MFVVIFGRVNGVNKKDKIEIARNILNNAANMNMSKEILLKISQKIDKYIVEYLREGEGQKGGFDERENV
jgi:sensor histidine kinase regulating citrate/malate metabolism